MGRKLTSLNLTRPDLQVLAPGVEISQQADPRRAFKKIMRRASIGGAHNSIPRGTLSATLVHPAHPLADELVLGRTLRFEFTRPGATWGVADGTASPPADREYWRVERVRRPETGDEDFEIQCRPIEDDLHETVARYEAGDGSVSPIVSIYDLTTTDALRFILESCGVPGNRSSHLGGNAFVFGKVAAALIGVSVSFGGEALTHADLLAMLTESCAAQGYPARIAYRHLAGRIEVDLEEAPPVGDYGPSVATIETKHCFDVSRTDDDDGRPNAIMPLGGEQGAAFTIGDLEWKVAAYDSGLNTLDVRNPIQSRTGEVGPVWASGALVGYYVGNDDNGWDEITGSSFPSTLSLAGSRPFAINEMVRIALDDQGTDLTVLRQPTLALTDTAHEEVRRYRDASPVPNLIETNDIDPTFGDLSTWNDVSTAVIGTETTGTLSDGSTTIGLTVNALGEGIETDWLYMDAEYGPYASAWLAAVPTEGAWAVEIIDGADNVFPDPDADERPLLNTRDSDTGISLAGMEVAPIMESGIVRKVKLRITAAELFGGSASIDLQQATLTQSAVEYAYRPGLGPHEIWSRAVRELRRLADNSPSEYSGSIVDPNVLNGNLDIALGAAVTLDLPSGSTDLPVTSIEEEWVQGFDAVLKEARFGHAEIDATEALGVALGVEVSPGHTPPGASASYTEAPIAVPRPAGKKKASRADNVSVKAGAIKSLALFSDLANTSGTTGSTRHVREQGRAGIFDFFSTYSSVSALYEWASRMTEQQAKDAGLVAETSNGGYWARRWNGYALESQWAGADERATASENTTALEATAAALSSGMMLVIPMGALDINPTTLDIPSDSGVIQHGSLVYDGTGVGLTIGSETDPVARLKIDGLHVTTNTVDHTPGRVAIDLVNLYESQVRVDRAHGCWKGVRCRGNNARGFVYNQVSLGYVEACKYGVVLQSTYDGATDVTDALEVGWANENSFYGGRFHTPSATPDGTGIYHFVIQSGPATTLTAAASAGATSLTVEDGSAYSMLTTPFDIDLNGFREGVEETVTVTNVTLNTLTVSALAMDHEAGEWATHPGYLQNNNSIDRANLEGVAATGVVRGMFIDASYTDIRWPRIEGIGVTEAGVGKVETIILGTRASNNAVSLGFNARRSTITNHGGRLRTLDNNQGVFAGGGTDIAPVVGKNVSSSTGPVFQGQDFNGVVNIEMLASGRLNAKEVLSPLLAVDEDPAGIYRGLFRGSTDPDGARAARAGSVYMRYSGDAFTGLYYKRIDDAGNGYVGGWTPVMIVAQTTDAEALTPSDIPEGQWVYDVARDRPYWSTGSEVVKVARADRWDLHTMPSDDYDQVILGGQYSGPGATSVNPPPGTLQYGSLIVTERFGGGVFQIAVRPESDPPMAMRQSSDSGATWTDWADPYARSASVDQVSALSSESGYDGDLRHVVGQEGGTFDWYDGWPSVQGSYQWAVGLPSSEALAAGLAETASGGGYWVRRWDGDVLPLPWTGADTSGSTDCSTQLADALKLSDATGCEVLATRGTYTVSGIDLDAESISKMRLRLDKNATIVHAASATVPLLLSASPVLGSITGPGKIDGNKANQTNRIKCLDLVSTLLYVGGDIHFTNTTRAAIVVENVSGRVVMQDARFDGMAEHGGTFGEQSEAVAINGSGVTYVQRCHFEAEKPSTDGAAPGGLIVTGTGPEMHISDCEFRGIGQAFPIAGPSNFIGCIDLYTNSDRATVVNCRFYDYRYQALKLQNSGEIICTGHRIHGSEGSTVVDALNIQPSIRTGASDRNNALVGFNQIHITHTGNLPSSSGDTPGGIMIQGGTAAGLYRTGKVQVVHNMVKGAHRSVQIKRTDGEVLVESCTLQDWGATGTSYGVLIEDCVGSVTVRNCDLDGFNAQGPGLFARTDVTTCDILFEGNRPRNIDSVGMTIRDARTAAMVNNVFGENVTQNVCDINGSGDTAVIVGNIAPSGSTRSIVTTGFSHVKHYGNSFDLGGLSGFNVISDMRTSGSLRLGVDGTLTFATPTQTIGIYPGDSDPEGAVNAPPSSMYLRTDGTIYRKEGVGTTGWIEMDRSAAASADAAADVSATYDQAEVQAILDELRDLKAKLRTANMLDT